MSKRFSRLDSSDATLIQQSSDLPEAVPHDDIQQHSHSHSHSQSSEPPTVRDDSDDTDDADTCTETDSDDGSAPLRQSAKQYSTLVWWMLAMSTAILYAGYDSAVLGTLNAVPAYQRDFGEWMQSPEKDDPNHWDYVIPVFWLSIWDGIGPLGQVIGSVLGGWMLDRTGRRFCLLVGSIIGAGAILMLVLANKPGGKDAKRIMILMGKIIQGFGLGIIKIETFTYMSEIVPVSLKGAVMALVPIMTLLGQLIGAIIIFAVSSSEKPSAYMIALGSQWVLAIPPLILAIFLPESPAYLLKKEDTQGASKSFSRLLGPKNNTRTAVNKLQQTLDEETKTSARSSYRECFNAANRRRTFIVMFASTLENFFGITLLSAVSYFLQQVGMSASKSILFLIAGVITGLIANIASAWTVTHIGRRKLTVSTLLVAAGLWAIMGFLGIKQYEFTMWIAGGICTAVVVVCGLGVWPASYAIMGETSAVRLRSRTQALGNLARSLATFLMHIVLPYFYNPDALNLGAKTGFFLAGLSTIGALLTYLFIPELKGRSALEIDHLFEQKVKSIGSSKWVDVEVEEVQLKQIPV